MGLRYHQCNYSNLFLKDDQAVIEPCEQSIAKFEEIPNYQPGKTVLCKS